MLVEPALEWIRMLHRDTDAFVTLHAADGDTGDFLNLQAIRNDRVSADFAGVADRLGRDAFVSINSYYRPWRCTGTLRYLNACFVDLDCHKAGLSPGQAVGAIHDMEDAGTLPLVSAFLYSGRGIWAFWLLESDECDGGPSRAYPRLVDRWRRIQAELCERTSHLGADPMPATDAARVCRVSGSFSSKAQVRTRHIVQFTASGNVPSYTFDGIDGALGINSKAPKRRPESASQSGTPASAATEHARKMRRGRYQKIADVVSILDELRAGFVEGTREMAVWLLKEGLRRSGTCEAEVERRLYALAARCRPRPLPTATVRQQLKAAPSLERGISDQKVADFLLITPDESRAIWDHGHKMPCAARFGLMPETTWLPPAKATAAVRRSMLAQWCPDLDDPPSRRALQARLAEAGVTAALGTIGTDLAALRDRGAQKHPGVDN